MSLNTEFLNNRAKQQLKIEEELQSQFPTHHNSSMDQNSLNQQTKNYFSIKKTLEQLSNSGFSGQNSPFKNHSSSINYDKETVKLIDQKLAQMKVPINNLRKINDTIIQIPAQNPYQNNHFTRNMPKKTLNLPLIATNTPNQSRINFKYPNDLIDPLLLKSQRTNLSVISTDTNMRAKHKIFYLEGQVISILNVSKQTEKEQKSFKNVYRNLNSKLKNINRTSVVSKDSDCSQTLQATIEEQLDTIIPSKKQDKKAIMISNQQTLTKYASKKKIYQKKRKNKSESHPLKIDLEQMEKQVRAAVGGATIASIYNEKQNDDEVEYMEKEKPQQVTNYGNFFPSIGKTTLFKNKGENFYRKFL
ncbi:UNKNOWN [Stylonychia lemnae]|uniref:Uncharacterized protein n=1 Tax=Stylonychia lemnae TaxID=5949 RepID=A0A078AHN6_STYLE|nr:UNKNOWN [Stylonychia lemnae]|eukprot:CDW81012.1 UNKNOWN [Stylonychia lemnae]